MRFRYNATFGDISDNIVEQLDLENMDISVGILFLAVLCAEIVLLSVLGGRHIYFRYDATFGGIVDNTIE